MKLPDHTDPAVSLALARTALGLGSLAAPKVAARLFMLNPGANPQLSYPIRLFASREIALGVATLLAPASIRTPLLAAGIAIDSSDAVAGTLALRDGEVGKLTAGVLTLPAVGAVGAGLVSLLLKRQPRRLPEQERDQRD